MTLNKKRLRGLIQIAVSALLLGLILRQVHWGEVRDALARIDVRWLALAWGLFLLGVIVRAARWQVLLDVLGVYRPLRELATWYFVGGFFNVILPTGFGGDAVRVAELAQDTSRPAAVLNSVLVDRYLGIMVLLPMGLVAAVLAPGAAPTGVTALTAVLFLGGLLVAWLLRRPWWARWGNRPDVLGRVMRALRLPALADAVAPYDRRTIGRGLAISLVFNLLQIGWNVAIGRGLGLVLPLTVYLAFVPLTAVALLLPAFGGLGVRELTYAGLFASAGVRQPTALALSLGVYVITVATGVVGGALYLVQGLRGIKATDKSG
ncbi:MAG: lysylphosphatidylglycerol synthase transmembrane domain-containing protein [Chloroflexi bacterium]|nr:lysylphosphatidylglycerol synthase transmembrane domain-containing protein [Chloroflexota bacterium]